MINWTPDGFIGRLFATMKPYAAPPPAGASPPPLWGDEDHVRDLFGDEVSDLTMRRETVVMDRCATPLSSASTGRPTTAPPSPLIGSSGPTPTGCRPWTRTSLPCWRVRTSPTSPVAPRIPRSICWCSRPDAETRLSRPIGIRGGGSAAAPPHGSGAGVQQRAHGEQDAGEQPHRAALLGQQQHAGGYAEDRHCRPHPEVRVRWSGPRGRRRACRACLEPPARLVVVDYAGRLPISSPASFEVPS